MAEKVGRHLWTFPYAHPNRQESKTFMQPPRLSPVFKTLHAIYHNKALPCIVSEGRL